MQRTPVASYAEPSSIGNCRCITRAMQDTNDDEFIPGGETVDGVRRIKNDAQPWAQLLTAGAG